MHSSILAWRIPWTEGAGGLQSMASKRVQARLTWFSMHVCIIRYRIYSTEQLCNLPIDMQIISKKHEIWIQVVWSRSWCSSPWSYTAFHWLSDLEPRPISGHYASFRLFSLPHMNQILHSIQVTVLLQRNFTLVFYQWFSILGVKRLQ